MMQTGGDIFYQTSENTVSPSYAQAGLGIVFAAEPAAVVYDAVASSQIQVQISDSFHNIVQ